ncbi:MAG: carboxypeptidase-like regulatory domain-containing protein [Solirubrobacterales bacterium]|nr:carboxypeptidase-like regulatory domain-containing protein [Solirubrobacterales bacterium]
MISTWYARVQVNDPVGPTLKVSGDPWSEPWVKPGAVIHVDASDASGVSQIRLLRDGSVVSTAAQSCDFTRPRPCADRSLDVPIGSDGQAPAGRSEYSVEALDAAGNRTRVSRTIGIDGSIPTSAAAPAVEGGDGWRVSPGFQLRWSTDQPDGASPVVSSRLEVCRATAEPRDCLADQSVTADEAGFSTAIVRVPARGEWEARIFMTDASGNVDTGSGSPAAKLRFDNAAPPAPAVSGPSGWMTRERARLTRLKPDVSSNVLFPSGTAGWSWALGTDPDLDINLAVGEEGISLADFPEGISDVRFRTVSGAGITSKTSTLVKVRVDDTPPTAALGGIQDGWQRLPMTVSVVGRDQSALSGMGASEDSNAEARLWVDGGLVDAEAGDSAQVVIDTDGVHNVAASFTDAAGNRSGRFEGSIRLDSTPPEHVVFLPQDVADPRVVRVEASDVTSGLTSVKVRMRPIAGGEWIPLAMELKGTRAVGLIDDKGLAPGVWEFEATATDAAGNVTTSDRTVVHDPALVTLPLRGPSTIEAHMGEGVGASASPSSLFTLAHGQGSAVSGRLLDRDGLPVAAGLLSLDAVTSAAGSVWAAVSTATTDHAGRFRFSIAAGPGRRIRVSYAGNRRDLATAAQMQIRVAATTTLRMSPNTVRVGAKALFSGVLEGGWIPSGGKLVIIQAAIPKRGWQTFGVARAGADGHWELPYRFRAAVGRVKYSIRCVVPSEGAYPFGAFTSRPISVTAVG